jgi:hypothetical protein
MRAEQLRRRTTSWVRLRAPPGIGSVQTSSGRHINVGLDSAIEMSAEDAQYYIRDGRMDNRGRGLTAVASSVRPGLFRAALVSTLQASTTPPSRRIAISERQCCVVARLAYRTYGPYERRFPCWRD